jgi:flagellar hook protein FlgE
MDAMNAANGIAQSGIEAYSTKMEVTANNIANVNSENFKASQVTMRENPNGGVDARVSQTADKVDISREAVEMLSTTAGFKANLKVLKTNSEMSQSLLDIIS